MTPSVLESVIKATGFRHQPHQYIECAEKYESVADRGDQRWPFLLDEGETFLIVPFATLPQTCRLGLVMSRERNWKLTCVPRGPAITSVDA